MVKRPQQGWSFTCSLRKILGGARSKNWPCRSLGDTEHSLAGRGCRFSSILTLMEKDSLVLEPPHSKNHLPFPLVPVEAGVDCMESQTLLVRDH